MMTFIAGLAPGQSTEVRMVSTMRPTEGSARSSSASAEGNGMCGVVMRTIGPSRSQNASSLTIETPGLDRLLQDRLGVERHQRARVDHRRIDAVLGRKDLGRLERPRHHGGERHDGHVLALAHDIRLPKRHHVLALGDLAFARVERLLLEEDDGVVVTHG
jgi:hypothetical protein